MITDICLVIIFALFVYNGYSKGFVKSVYSVLSLVVTVILVSVLKDNFLKLISQSPIALKIGEFFAGSGASAELAAVCAENVTYLLSTIMLYLLVRIVLKFSLNIVNSIASLPVINSLNKLLGLLIGAVIGIIWLLVIVNVMNVIPETAEYIETSALAGYFQIF